MFRRTAPTAGVPPRGAAHKALAKAGEALKKTVSAGVPTVAETRRHIACGPIRAPALKAIQTAGAARAVMAAHAPDSVRELLVGSYADRIARRSAAFVPAAPVPGVRDAQASSGARAADLIES